MKKQQIARCGIFVAGFFLATGTLGPFTPIVRGQAPSLPPAELTKLLVNPTTFLVAELEPAQIGVPKLLESDAAGVWASGLLTTLKQAITELQEVSGGGKVYLTMDVPYSAQQASLTFYVPKPTPVKMQSLVAKLAEMHWSAPISKGSFVAFSPTTDLEASLANAIGRETFPAERLELATALRAVPGAPVRMAIIPPAYLRRTLQEMMPRLPEEWGGSESSLLSDGLQWAAVAIDPAKLSIESVVQSKGPDSAEAFAKFLPELLVALAGQLPEGQFAAAKALAKPLAGMLKPQVSGSQVTLGVSGEKQMGSSSNLLAALADQVIRPMVGRQRTDRLKQLALAMHNHASAYKSFPVAAQYRAEDGTTGLSWRVHLLPFLGEAELFKKFHLDEAWDSEHNIQLLEQIPNVYKSPTWGLKTSKPLPPGHTIYSAPVSERTILGRKEATRFSMMTDGSSNTLMLIELRAESAVPWTAPQDYAFDPAHPKLGLQLDPDGSFLAARGDGSVSSFPSEVPDKEVVYLFEMNDGQVTRW